MNSPEVGARTAVLQTLQNLAHPEDNSGDVCLKESVIIKQMYTVYEIDLESYRSAIEDLEKTGMIKSKENPESNDRYLCFNSTPVKQAEEINRIKHDLLALFD